MNLLCVGVGGWIFEALMKLIVFRKKKEKKGCIPKGCLLLV